MNLEHAVITLSDITQTLLSDDGDNLYYNVDLTIQNIDPEANVYVGVDGVSAASFGALLFPGSTTSFGKLGEEDKIYAISDINGSKVAIFRSSSISKAIK